MGKLFLQVIFLAGKQKRWYATQDSDAGIVPAAIALT
jgi:hypothetical protein